MQAWVSAASCHCPVRAPILLRGWQPSVRQHTLSEFRLAADLPQPDWRHALWHRVSLTMPERNACPMYGVEQTACLAKNRLRNGGLAGQPPGCGKGWTQYLFSFRRHGLTQCDDRFWQPRCLRCPPGSLIHFHLVGDTVAEYRLLTIWRIEAPLEEVYAAIHNAPRWPDW